MMKIRFFSFILIIFVFFSSFEIFVFQNAYASDGRIDYYDINFDGENDNYYSWENKADENLEFSYISDFSDPTISQVNQTIESEYIRGNKSLTLSFENKSGIYVMGNPSPWSNSSYMNYATWYELSFMFEGEILNTYMEGAGYVFEITEDGALWIGGKHDNTTYHGQKAHNVNLRSGDWYNLVIGIDNTAEIDGETRYYAWLNGTEIITDTTFDVGCANTCMTSQFNSKAVERQLLIVENKSGKNGVLWLDDIKIYSSSTPVSESAYGGSGTPMAEISKNYYDINFDSIDNSDLAWKNLANSNLDFLYWSGGSSLSTNDVNHKIDVHPTRGNKSLSVTDSGEGGFYVIGNPTPWKKSQYINHTTWYELSFKFEDTIMRTYMEGVGYPFDITPDGKLWIGGRHDNSNLPGTIATNVQLVTDKWYRLIVAVDNVNKYNSEYTRYYAWLNDTFVITEQSANLKCTAVSNCNYPDIYDVERTLLLVDNSYPKIGKIYFDDLKIYTDTIAVDATVFRDISKKYYNITFDSDEDTNINWTNTVDDNLSYGYWSGGSTPSLQSANPTIVEDLERNENVLKLADSGLGGYYVIGNSTPWQKNEYIERTAWYEISFKFEEEIIHMYMEGVGYPFEITEDGSLWIGGRHDNYPFRGSKASDAVIEPGIWYSLIVAADNVNKYGGKYTRYYAWLNGTYLMTDITEMTNCSNIVTYTNPDYYDVNRSLLLIDNKTPSNGNIYLDDIKIYTAYNSVEDSNYHGQYELFNVQTDKMASVTLDISINDNIPYISGQMECYTQGHAISFNLQNTTENSEFYSFTASKDENSEISVSLSNISQADEYDISFNYNNGAKSQTLINANMSTTLLLASISGDVNVEEYFTINGTVQMRNPNLVNETFEISKNDSFSESILNISPISSYTLSFDIYEKREIIPKIVRVTSDVVLEGNNAHIYGYTNVRAGEEFGINIVNPYGIEYQVGYAYTDNNGRIHKIFTMPTGSPGGIYTVEFCYANMVEKVYGDFLYDISESTNPDATLERLVPNVSKTITFSYDTQEFFFGILPKYSMNYNIVKDEGIIVDLYHIKNGVATLHPESSSATVSLKYPEQYYVCVKSPQALGVSYSLSVNDSGNRASDKLMTVNIGSDEYYISVSDGLTVYKNGAKYTLCTQSGIRSLTYHSNTLYYSTDNAVYKLNQGIETKLLGNVRGIHLVSDGASLYYVNLSDNSKIYKYNLSDGSHLCVCNDSAAWLTLDGATLYYQNQLDENKIYSISTDAENVQSGIKEIQQ